ncbi:hypothetical protein [Sporosarcina sp. E16_8]|uniref:hypothetical protein n=1 Tax=Sporosarcina sp. E16_8 TaxID=2789295 RepID=UPI001A93529D|nr:hypothetical protein [Sporosarcina sp. E16_8]MBO0587983.1 hypothetical protein [Sporosarcina sp. E16_8]
MSKKKDALVMVISLLAIWISLSEFLNRDILVSKLFALLFLIVSLYLFVVTVKDLFRKEE